MGAHVTKTDYDWVYTEEPHATRRKQILEKYPQVKKLMGCDANMKFKVLFMVTLQIIAAYLMKDASWPLIILTAYCFGGVVNHAMTLAIHEISHNLAFGHLYPLRNRALGIFGNVILGFPMSISFKKYHLEHHKYQGDEEIDMDIPTKFEGDYFTNTFMKFIWVILQPVFYALRPVFVRPKPISLLEVINLVVCIVFNAAIVYFFGYKSLVYLLISTPLAMGFHPVAGHFISEHYVFAKGYETYSYYGPLNAVTFNVGYHNEHHDFPNIPGTNLPKLKKIAPDFYDNLPCHESWMSVIWQFITDPEIGPYARIRRNQSKPAQNGQRPVISNGDMSNGKKD